MLKNTLKSFVFDPIHAFFAPYDPRHTAASLAIHAGASIKMIQTMLGHKSLQVTLDVYADLFDEEQDTVADALDAQIEHTRTDSGMVTLE